MRRSIEAVYEDGRFRPLEPVGDEIEEGSRVPLLVGIERRPAEEVLDLAG